MPPSAAPEDPTALRHERDLYRRLLELVHESAPEPFFQEALGLLVDATRAGQGYLEVHDETDPPGEPRWWSAHGLSAERVQDVRRTISRSIIAEAVTDGQTVSTPDALLDERFQGRDSVRRGSVRAVLCAPIGAAPVRGVVYLASDPGHPFSDDDRHRVELVTRHLAPLADRLLLQGRVTDSRDPTRPWRERLRVDSLIGRSAAIAEVLAELAIAAPSSKNALLIGDTGTGKSHLARLIHDNGPRARRPFVGINCTTLPHDLAEAELFGSLKGAFTDAKRDHPGLVAQAEGGTLFLDEIGDLSPKVQVKLLDFLQSKTYRRLGDDRAEPLTADVRIIAGTNVDLDRAVADGTFRSDLLYRLNVIAIRMPSLAEHREDIAELAGAFCTETCRSEGHSARPLSGDALRALETAEWPGNVRQLENVVIRGVLRAVSEDAPQVERRHLFRDAKNRPQDGDGPLTYQEATREFQKGFLEKTLAECRGNISEAARRIDVTRPHLHTLLKVFSIEPRR